MGTFPHSTIFLAYNEQDPLPYFTSMPAIFLNAIIPMKFSSWAMAEAALFVNRYSLIGKRDQAVESE